MTTSPTVHHPAAGSSARFRHVTIAIFAALAITALVIAGSAGTASAHEGHRSEIATRTDRPETARSETMTATSRGETAELATRTLRARRTIDQLHLAAINDVEVGTFDRGRTTGDLIQVPGRGQSNPLDVDCYVDFDDDLTIQFHVPGGAENTFMTGHWYQKCYDSSYPAVAVKFLNYGHFHLGYEDPRIGPCGGDQTDWGRKANTPPAGEDAFIDWVMEDCASDIDPYTEPRSGISAHSPGHRGKIVAYDGDGHRPFQLRTFEVVSGEVEVCHLPAGPIVVANGGGSPWQCTTWDEGYWNMSNHIPSAIEVRFEFLTNGQVDNIGVDLL